MTRALLAAGSRVAGLAAVLVAYAALPLLCAAAAFALVYGAAALGLWIGAALEVLP